MINLNIISHSLPSPSRASPEFQSVIESGDWEIIDTVQVLEGLEGDFIVSWRWDTEQIAQVWIQCSIVTIGA